MERRFNSFVAAVLLFSIGMPFRVNGQPAAPTPPLTEISVGEHARIQFTWLGIPVAQGHVELREMIRMNGRDAWHVVAHVRTHKVLSLFYPVRDEYHSYIDVESLESLRFEKNVREGTYRADEVVEYDHEKGRGYYYSRLNKSEKTFATAPVIHDPISAIYWFRAFAPMPVGDVMDIPVNYEEKNWNVRVPFLEREETDFGELGIRRVVRTQPYISNLEEHVENWNSDHQKMLRGSRVTAWVDEQKGRIPIQVAVKVPFVGSIKISITEFKPGQGDRVSV